MGFLQLTPGSISAIPQFTESARGLALLDDRVGPDAVTPIEIVVDTGVARGASLPAVRAATARLVGLVSHDPEAYITAHGAAAPYVDASGRYRRVFVVGRHEFGDPAMQALVRRLRSTPRAGGAVPRGRERLRRRRAGAGRRLPRARVR